MNTKEIVKELARKPEIALNDLRKFIEIGKTPKTGITGTPILLSLAKEFANELENRKESLEILKKLWKIGGRDEKLLVIFTLERFAKRTPEPVFSLVKDLVQDIDNWEVCDQMALKVTVFLLIKLDSRMWDTLSGWKNSQDPWLRRLAIATIPPYIRRKPQEAEKCLLFLESVMTDKKREVKKVLSWALREISKKDPVAAYNFMKKWHKAAPSVVNSGMKKLPPDLQERLLNGI